MSKKMTYEEAIKRLNEIAAEMDSDELSLDKSMALFEEGTNLSAFCNKLLNEAEQKIIELEKE